MARNNRKACKTKRYLNEIIFTFLLGNYPGSVNIRLVFPKFVEHFSVLS